MPIFVGAVAATDGGIETRARVTGIKVAEKKGDRAVSQLCRVAGDPRLPCPSRDTNERANCPRDRSITSWLMAVSRT